MAKSDKFIWKKGDVQVYKNEKDWKKSTKKKKSTSKVSKKGKK